MAAPIYINVGDAAEGADLARSLGRHGLEAGLAWSDARWQVEVRSPRDAAVFRLRAFLVAVGWFEFSRRREQLAVLASAEAARLVRESAETACAGPSDPPRRLPGSEPLRLWVAKFAIHEAAATAREIAAGRRKAEAVGDQSSSDLRREGQSESDREFAGWQTSG